MTDRRKFNKAKSKNLKSLTKFVPVVARVHGESHPELRDVQRVFDELNTKLKEAGRKIPDIGEEFAQLRDITSNYTLPEDACETYVAVYNMLEELDKAYQ